MSRGRVVAVISFAALLAALVWWQEGDTGSPDEPGSPDESSAARAERGTSARAATSNVEADSHAASSGVEPAGELQQGRVVGGAPAGAGADSNEAPRDLGTGVEGPAPSADRRAMGATEAPRLPQAAVRRAYSEPSADDVVERFRDTYGEPDPEHERQMIEVRRQRSLEVVEGLMEGLAQQEEAARRSGDTEEATKLAESLHRLEWRHRVLDTEPRGADEPSGPPTDSPTAP